MSNNREERVACDVVHLYLALQREGTAKDKKCIRQVIKDESLDLDILVSKCKTMGGSWRIHKTVNARDCEKARKLLFKILIDYPERASVIDSEWRTCLLQKECAVTRFFMLDVDTQDIDKLNTLENEIAKDANRILSVHKTPKGYHYILENNTLQNVRELEFVTILRDGFYYVKSV